MAYVDDQDGDTISCQRGGYGKPGFGARSATARSTENLDLLRRMRAGEFPDGAHVLRAKIDMQHENMQLRDPVMYRIRRGHHWRTGEEWVIYPTYDWAHGQSDAIEGVTHSLCTLEFDSHRPSTTGTSITCRYPAINRAQTEFARLELTHTITSKRRLSLLVKDGVVDGWDDPRMPTLRGLRRRGYPARGNPRVLHVHRCGPNEQSSLHRAVGVVHPPRAQRDVAASNGGAATSAPRHHQLARRRRRSPGGRAPRGGQQSGERRRRCSSGSVLQGAVHRAGRLHGSPATEVLPADAGREVRLRSAYLVTCTGCVKDGDGNVVEVHCTYDPATSGGNTPDGRKVKSTMHWVSADHAVDATVALYDRLFSAEVPGEATGDPFDDLNVNSRELLTDCKVEPVLADTPHGSVVQFERLGYFAHDSTTPMLFHRTVGLRDEWANIQKRTATRRCVAWAMSTRLNGWHEVGCGCISCGAGRRQDPCHARGGTA